MFTVVLFLLPSRVFLLYSSLKNSPKRYANQMMRATRPVAFRASLMALNNGPTFLTGGAHNDSVDVANAYPMGERGIRSSSPFVEPNTAVYEAYMPWTYFQPHKVDVEKMPAPEAKYYQRLTKKPWDISSTELIEITSRKKFSGFIIYTFLVVLAYFYVPKEKSYSGLHGPDGWWILLPKNKPEYF